MDDTPVRVQHFHETAHVRPLEFLRQVHEQTNCRHGVLHCVRLIAHLDGKAQPAHAYFINTQFAMVALTLLVRQLRAFGRFDHTGSTHGHRLANHGGFAKNKCNGGLQAYSDNRSLKFSARVYIAISPLCVRGHSLCGRSR